MRHFLKPIAVAALAMATVGAAHASLRGGGDLVVVAPPAVERPHARVPASLSDGRDGNGTFFFSVWDGDSSYTRATEMRMNTLLARIAEPGLFSFSLAPDPLFLEWLIDANIEHLQWGASAFDTFGVRRHIDSIPQGASVTPQLAANVRAYLADNSTWLDRKNMRLQLSPTHSAVVEYAEHDWWWWWRPRSDYAGHAINYGCDTRGMMGFSRCGTADNATIETGLNLIRVDARRLPLPDGSTTYALLNDTGAAFPVRVWIDFDRASPTFGQFNVAAVPEPETYAMLFAGLGLVAAIAARRRQRG